MIKAYLLGAAVMGGMLGCATDSAVDRTKLEFVATGKSTLTVGDTSALWVMSKTSLTATGRSVTTKPYTHFILISSDTDVVAVVNTQRLSAKQAGFSLITANDDMDASLTAETAVKITVVDPD